MARGARRLRSPVLATFLATGLAAGAARADLDPLAWWSQHATLSTQIDLEWAIDTHFGATQKAELIVTPELELELPAGLDLTAIVRLRGDAFDRIEPGRPTEHERSSISRRRQFGNQIDLELRELYLDAFVGPVFMRLGKQQIVWGQADGLKVLDLVNPQTFREFILDDFDESRIPLWTLNVEVPVARQANFQLVWIPDPTFDQLPEPGALYEFTSDTLIPEAPPGIPVTLTQVRRPRSHFEDSDAGFRLTAFVGGWDLSFNYLYHFFDAPALEQKVPSPAELATGAPVLLSPRYHRTHTVGGTLSNAFGNLTLRGELAYNTNRFLPTNDPTDRDGVYETGELAYVLGFDWYGVEETLLSFQLFQNWLPGWESGGLRRELDTSFTLLWRREFWNDTLELETLWIQSWNNRDALVRPKVTWEWRDGVELIAQLDYFFGSKRRDGIFRQYNQNDRLVLKIRWTF